METALILYTQAEQVPVLVDLYENENISLNYSFNDIKDLTPRGNYSRTFRIPFTETNASVFGFVQENTVQFSNFNPKRKINASITVDTIPIIEGYVQFKAAYTTNGEVSDLEIVFFGNVVDFFKTIGDADFKNYIAGELTINYNDDLSYSILSTYNASNEIYFGFTDRGQNWVGQIDEAGTRSIYTTNQDVACSIGELTPFVSSRYIFDKIFALSGFQFNEDQSTTLANQLDKMWIPWSGEAGSIQTIGNSETAKFKLQAGIDGQTVTKDDFVLTVINGVDYMICEMPNMTEVYDYGNNVASNVYTAPISGRYQIIGSICVQFSSAFQYDLHAGIITNYDGVDYIQPYTKEFNLYNIQTGGYFLNTPLQRKAATSWSPDVISDNYLYEGTTARLVLYSISPNINGFSGTITFRDVDESQQNSFYSESITKPFFGNPIDWSANAPVMKCNDFMSSLFKMFNLVVIPDDINPKLLTLKPIQEYLSEGSTKDWSNKIDISKDITLMSTADSQSQENLWTYKSSTDYINSLYNSQGDRVYGRLLLIDPENDFATKEQKTELMFSPTPLALIKSTDFAIPKFITSTGQYVNGGPRILYRTESTIDIKLINDVTQTIVTQTLDLFSHYTTPIPSLSDEDLNFGQEIPLHPINSTPWKTLYARYWNDYIADIYAPDARILEGFFALDFADIYQFKFNDKIFIKDAYWRILEISDYVVGMQDTVKVKLIKMVSATPDCLLTPKPVIGINGNIIWEDAEGETKTGTEACCNQYGYFWLGSQCYASPRDSKGSGGIRESIKDDLSKFTSDVNNKKSGLIQADNAVVKIGNDRSIVISDTSYLGSNNNGSFVSGNRNYVNDGLGSVTVIGDAAKTINREMTIGGGGAYAGQYQSGIIQLNGVGTWTNSTTGINLLANRSAITMPNDSVWYIKLMIVASHADETGIDFGVTAEFNFNLQNSGGISLKNITLVDTYSAGISGDMEVDMNISGSTFNPIVYLKNSSYPIADVNVTAQLIYTQYHYE